MMILAHRGNIDGPNRSNENSIEACLRALEAGFGLEIDLRRDSTGSFYLSHDRLGDSRGAELARYEPCFRKFDLQAIAVNIKEIGYESELVQLWRKGIFGKGSFYFDFELLEPENPGRSQRMIAGELGATDVSMAARLSDHGESLEQCLSIPSEVVWADEFYGSWLTCEQVRAVQKVRRRFVAVSPELHGGSDRERIERWTAFKNWGIDGICTDFALSAREFFLT